MRELRSDANRLFPLAALLTCLLLVHTTIRADEPISRLPAPTPSRQAAAEQRIRSVFKAEYADRTTRGRVNLARRLLKEANSSNDPDTRFVLLREARDRAADAANLAIAFDAIDAMDESFVIDSLAIKGDIASRAGPSANSQGDYNEVISACLEVMDEAIASDRYDVAMKVTSLADSAASKTKSMALVSEIDSRVKEIRLLNAEYNRAKSALTQLKADPNNAAASLAVGRYTAFFKGNWEEGLPMLAKGSDPSLKTVAALDLQNPTESAREFAVGNAWWDLAERNNDLVKSHMRERAGYWYRQAYPNLSGLDKTQAEKRLTELQVNVSNLAATTTLAPDKKLEPGLVAELYNDMFFRNPIMRRIDSTILFDWGRGGPDPRVGGGRYSIRWTGILMAPRFGVASIGVEVDDGVHVFIDEEAVVRMDRPHSKIFTPVKLSAGPHTIRIEYFNKLGVGRMRLFWTLNAFPNDQQPIPADALLHAPAK
jgi:hypothetical protein